MVDKVLDLHLAQFLAVGGVGSVITPFLFTEESLLQRTHMLLHGILGIALHP